MGFPGCPEPGEDCHDACDRKGYFNQYSKSNRGDACVPSGIHCKGKKKKRYILNIWLKWEKE